ncbi:B-cell receptor CD22-like [Schistocerca gregaria]|uniref:B-cell receptor CD22-like n=1 Tax=Schistocerca gregaria TaxID=7010 RepID=UPI00211EA0EC|nr:B-cell receptor CD22-like [Schistocerca gregaria]
MVVNHNTVILRAAATTRPIAVILMVMISLQHAAAQDRSPPSSILINVELPLTAGRNCEITCRIVGWETSPNVSWWLGDQRLMDTMEEKLVSEEGNETVSILLLTPLPTDNGETLKCQAEGADGILEKSVKLLVYYAPIVSIQLERPLRADDIREGDNVALTCKLRSNPPSWRVKWMLQGRLLEEIHSRGPLIQTFTLRLNAINRTMAGNYSCVSSNAVGDTESPPLPLTIMHEPVCRWQHSLMYTVPLGKQLDLNCDGAAVPPPDSYRWIFSRSMETAPFLTPTRDPSVENIPSIKWKGGPTWRNYQLKEDADYGTFYCSAINALGQQQRPCVFHVVPPGGPKAPSNCSVVNEKRDVFAVRCPTETDRGFRQSYQIEIYDLYTGYLLLNKTQLSPVFLLGGIEQNRQVTIRIAAVSPRGRSEWTRINIVGGS